MKGIILAGGSGTRLHPLTMAVSKQLLPVYDKPMIYYPLSTLMLAGIREICIITTFRDHEAFKKLLGDGSQWGIELRYVIQPYPAGLAQAFILTETFIGKDDVTLILGDNLFYGSELSQLVSTSIKENTGATVFSYYVNNPSAYGVVEFGENEKPVAIIEKPKNPPSNYAVTGLYIYDNRVVDIAKEVKVSHRGELEISDVNQAYLDLDALTVKKFSRGVTWLDTGTIGSLLEAAQFIEVIENRQGLKVCCPEEIAWRMKFISSEKLRELIVPLYKSGYGQYLEKILNEEKIKESEYAL